MSRVNTFGIHGSWDLNTAEGMENAIAWQLKLFSTLADGGKWVVPRSGTIYTIHHAKKTVVRRLGFAPEPDIERVIRAAGWTVLAMRRAPEPICSQCSLTQPERAAYEGGCPMRFPNIGCPFYDR